MDTNLEFKLQFKKYAIPMIIRSVFNSLMFTADKLVAALFIGTSALVATTLISPLMFLIGSLAMFFISGLGAYVGLLIGKGSVKKANEISSAVIVLMTILGLALTLPSLVFSNQIAHMLGARGEFFVLSVDYLQVFSLCFPLLLVGKGLDVLILNDGSPRYSFILNIITTTLNVVLNIIAVAILGFGIKGLAAATVISSAVQLLGGLWYFYNYSKIIHLIKPVFHMTSIFRVIYNGFSDFIMTIVEAVMIFVINIAFVNFLTPSHFEAYAVVSIITTLFYGVYMGSVMGLQPILSQMMAKGEFENLKKLINYSVKQTFIYAVVLYLGFLLAIDQVLILFIRDAYTFELAKFFYVTVGFATLFSNYPLQLSIFFTAINRPMESALISVFRTLVLIPPITYLFIIIFGALGVSLGFIFADIMILMGIFIYMTKIDLSKLEVYE